MMIRSFFVAEFDESKTNKTECTAKCAQKRKQGFVKTTILTKMHLQTGYEKVKYI